MSVPVFPRPLTSAFGLPGWLVTGLAAAGAFTVFAAVLFWTGTRVLAGSAHRRRAGDGSDRVVGETRRRAEIREYLDALGESYAEDHPVAGQPVAFYLPERDVAVTFDPRTYFRIETTGTTPVLAEHELPGASLGRRLPFETPDPTPSGTPGAEPGRDRREAAVESAFEVLGVAPDADPGDVRAAYRERVKAVHPDQGGDPEEFRRVREAYAVATGRASGSSGD